MIESRIELAQEIIDICLKMNSVGLNQGTAGNVSSRYKDGMLITPTGIEYEALTPDHIVFVDSEGNFEDGKIPSSEWAFHLVCYKAREDCNAVVHNHAINATAVSILNRPIKAIHYMVAASGSKEIPCIPYATFGSPQLAKYVENGIKESKAILLQHHGMITVGECLKKAFWLAHETEVLAELLLKCSAVQADIPILPSEEMDHVLEKFKSYGLRVEK